LSFFGRGVDAEEVVEYADDGEQLVRRITAQGETISMADTKTYLSIRERKAVSKA